MRHLSLPIVARLWVPIIVAVGGIFPMHVAAAPTPDASTTSGPILPKVIEIKPVLRPIPEEHDPVDQPPRFIERPSERPRPIPSGPALSHPTVIQEPSSINSSPSDLPPINLPPSESVFIFKNVDLSPATNDGWEPNVASSGKTVFFTTNYRNAFSADSGMTYQSVDPIGFMSDVPGGFCCDQVVQYIPSIDRFVWLAQSNPVNDENEYRLASASPQQLISSNGTKWTSWDLKSHDLAGSGHWFDYPEISFDEKYLFLGANAVGTGKGFIARMLLSEVASEGALNPEQALVDGLWVRPVQNTSGRGVFAANALVQFRDGFNPCVFSWSDGSSFDNSPHCSELAGSTDWQTRTPHGNDWLNPLTKIGLHIYSATQAKDKIFLAWSSGRFPSIVPYPHIEIEVRDAVSLGPVEDELIFNQDFAYAWPALATNADGDVAISLEFGGGSKDVAHGVGFRLGDNNWRIVPTTSSPGIGGGGHYLGIRPIPNSPCLAAAGYVATPDPSNPPFGYSNHPRYVEFASKLLAHCP